MKIHNILEEIVASSVDEYFNSLDTDKKLDCDDEQCKLDITCFVLNNMLPKYVVSTRGIIHYELDYTKKIQLEADIMYSVKKGYSIISQRKRAMDEINQQAKAAGNVKNCPYFNFPNVMGKVINGTTFEPIADAEVKLVMNGAPSDLPPNSITINKHTRGMFTICPYSIEADKIGSEQTFKFKLTVNHPDFIEYIKVLEITAVSEENYLSSIQLQNTKILEDIFIFPKGV